MFSRKILYNLHIVQSINFSLGEIGHPVAHYGSMSPLEQDAKSAAEVGDSLTLKLSGVPGHHTSKLFHLPLSTWVPATQGFCHQEEEGDPLLPTVLFSSPELTVMGKVERVTRLRGCPHHCGVI